jgi:tetratricopeptide (TPR) repeat protein
MQKIFLLLLLLISNFTFAQNTLPSDTSKRYEDSIIKHYIQNGAYIHSYYHPEWRKNFDSAIALLPNKAFLYQQQAMPLYKRHKYEAGKPYLDKAVELDKQGYLPYRGFMNCIFRKNYHDAIVDFSEAKRLWGNGFEMDHEYDFYIGLSYLQLNKFDSAKILFQKCIDEEGKKYGEKYVHQLNYFYLAITESELENYPIAVSYLDSCLIKYPNFSDAQYYKACWLKHIDKNYDSQPLFKEAYKNSLDGYSISEDNTFYELYPYQLQEKNIKSAIKIVKPNAEKLK